MAVLTNNVKAFVDREVIPSVQYFDKNNIYPTALIEIMKSMGLFGLTIPKIYGGLEVDVLTHLQVIEELSSGWLSLCSILDSHLRVCSYIVNFGTDEQKAKYLPLLAKGQLIAAHANTEKNNKTLEKLDSVLTNVKGSLKTWTLSGRKEWVSNAKNADIFAVIVRIALQEYSDLKCSSSSGVVLVTKDTNGLVIENEWNRMGVRGISLAPVIFHNCLVEIKNVIGEFLYDGKTLVESFHSNLSMVSAARSVRVSKVLIEKCAKHLLNKKRNDIIGSLTEEPCILMRFGELITKFEAAQSLYNECCSKMSTAYPSKFLTCKVFASETAKEISLACMQLFGGSGYTSEYDIERYVRDTLSLTIIHSPSDIALTRIGQTALNHFKVKEQHPQSSVLHYAPHVLTNIKYEYLLNTTLQEQEKIINTGYYPNTNIQLFLYDMTTLNPSATFKDFIGCLTFAYCLQNNINRICAQSSGNTAMSFIHYARKNPNIKLIQFYLTENSYKINSTIVPDNVLLIEVNSTKSEMERLLTRFSELTNIPIMPNLKLQIDADKIRAHFLNDNYFKNGIYFNWYVQALSSASSPIGLYEGFTEIEQLLSPPPKFLCVQQEAISPFTQTLDYLDNEIHEKNNTVDVIEPTLFCSDHSRLKSKVENILDTYGGKFKLLKNDSFKQYLNQSIELLSKNNIQITKTNDNNIFEKAGVSALAATLHEIDNVNHSVISSKENVLIAITGGTRCPSKEKLEPKLILDKHSSDEQLKLILKYV